MKVLIVDDEYSLRFTLSEFLKRDGFETETAVNAAEGWSKIQEERYDIVLTDIIMPGMSGIDLIEKIRTMDSSVKVIIMTGEPTVDTAVEAVRHGASDYIMKPITKQNLLRVVSNAARIKELEDTNSAYHVNLEQLISKRTNSLQTAMQGVIFLLSSISETKDPYTAGHQRRVGNLAAAIAAKMGLAENEENILRIIGYIHDIGKIVLPGEILSKPGKLSDLKLQMIRMHSQYGYDMIATAKLPEVIGRAILRHHERSDGSGYPGGVKGDGICLEAKIIAIADVVEAMASHRPYRPALGIDAALSEIRKNQGILYDKEIAAACIALFEQDRYTLNDELLPIRFPDETDDADGRLSITSVTLKNESQKGRSTT